MASSRSDVFIVAPDLPPISAVAVERSRELPEIVRAVHVFAARHPEVLNYMPCFCGCGADGHRNNRDCYVKHVEPDGSVMFDSMAPT